MLASMNDEFSKNFEEAYPEEILQKLKESFRMLGDIERYRVSCTIFNTRMHEGALIIDHVLYMV